jgi:hypothetical protein
VTTAVDGETQRGASWLGPFADRFELEAKVGTGGYGTVYRARDRVQRRRVAVKVPHVFDADALLALKREFRALSGVSHPNLVAFHELFVGPEQWFFTMELVHGLDCVRWVERAGPGSFEGVVRGLAAGLAALHASRIVHRDLKPSNAWVDARGTPILLDFGLARSLAAGPDGSGGAEPLAGTPLYLAPELLRGGAPSPASDAYALGALLHELASGRPPFEGSRAEVLARKLASEPVRVRALRPGVSPRVAHLVEALLDPDPAARPSAEDVLGELGTGGAAPRAEEPARAFVGRASELAELRTALGEVLGGAPRIVFVEGVAGIGKSTLVTRFLEQSVGAGDVVLRGRCSEHEAVPFKTLDGCIDALASRLRIEPALRALVRADELEALAEVFPVLGATLVGGARSATSAVEPQERRRLVGRALAGVLSALAQDRTVFLVLDDLHWADEDGARLLDESLSALPGCRLLVLAIHRGGAESGPLGLLTRAAGPRPARSAPARGRARGASGASSRRLVVSPLDRDEARALLAHAPGAEALLAVAGGSPFLLETLASSGLGASSISGRSAESVVRDAVAARLARLTATQRALVEVVCVAGHALPHDVAAEALGLEVDVASVRALGALRLVRTAPSPGRGQLAIEPYHDRLREVVADLVGPSRALALHGALARAFAGRADEEPMWACVHWEGAGQLSRAARYAEDGARRAAEALAFARAAELYRFALDHASRDDAEASALEAALGDALANAGRGREAAEAFLSASRRARDPEGAFGLRRRATEQLLRAGYFDEGVAHLDAVLESAGVRARKGPVASIASLVVNRRWLDAKVRVGLVLSPSARVDPAEQRRIDALCTGAVGLSVVDSIRSADLMSEALRRAVLAGDGERLAVSLSWWTAFLANEGGPREASTRASLAAAERAVRADGSPYARACLGAASALTEFHLGHFALARQHCDDALSLFERATRGTTKEASTLHIFHHATLAIDGQLDELARRTEERVRVSEARGERYALVNYRQGLMILRWLAVDRPDRALEDLDLAMRDFGVQGFVVQHWFDVWGRVVVALYEGRAREARAVWSRARPRLATSLLARTQFTRVQSYALEALTAAAVLCDPGAGWRARSAARAWAGLAVSRAQREDRPWTAALAAVLEASVRAASGDEAGGLRRLEAALPALERTGLGLYAALARHHLGARDPAMRASAEAWAEREGVVRLDRLASAILPGFGRPGEVTRRSR